MANICLKIFITLLALLELFSGIAITGLASATREMVSLIPMRLIKFSSEKTYAEEYYPKLKAGVDLITDGATAIIAFGLLMMIAAMWGIYGACCESQCLLLYMYIPAMGILAAADVIIGVLIFVGRNKLVSWFGDITDCDACAEALKRLTSLAVPAAGIGLFSALPKIFAIYCAWRIIKKLREKYEDKKLMRNLLKGHHQQNTQQPIFILNGGAPQQAAPIQNNVNNIVFPGQIPMGLMGQPTAPTGQQNSNSNNNNNNNSENLPAPILRRKLKPQPPGLAQSVRSDGRVPAPPPLPPIGTPRRKQLAFTMEFDENEYEYENYDERPRNPTPNAARKYNNLSSDSMKRSQAKSNVLLNYNSNISNYNDNNGYNELTKSKLSEKYKVNVKPNNVQDDSRKSSTTSPDNVFLEEGDSHIIVNRTRLSSLPSEYRRTFGSGTSGMVSVVEEDMR